MDAQAAFCSLWGLRMVAVQLESIPSRDYASALFGSRRRFAVNAAEQRELSRLGHRISFRKKQAIFTEDEPATAVYLLTHGTAVLYKMTANGRRQIVGFALPGDFLGSPFQDCCSCSVDAISQVKASRFFTGPFLTFIRSRPASLCQMLEAVLQSPMLHAITCFCLVVALRRKDLRSSSSIGVQGLAVLVLPPIWCRCQCRAPILRISLD